MRGTVIPCGAIFEHHSVSGKDQSRRQQFGEKVLLGNAVCIWKGDIMVADSEELENLDSSQIHARRLNAKEVLMPNNGNHFKCPIADGHSQVVWKRAGFPKIHLKPGLSCTSRRAQRCSSRQSRTRVIHQTRSRMTVKPETIFWTIAGNCICRHLCRKENHSRIHCDFF